MKTSFSITDPQETEMTLTVTMPLADWIQLKDQIPNAFPSYHFKNTVSDMVEKAIAHFTSTETKER